MNAPDIIHAMARHNVTLAIAESYTGGLVHDALTSVPGASRVLLGAIVAYDDDAKRGLLRVRARSLAQLGAVSETAALEMAQGARERFGADYGLSTTGIAGPDGARDLKPLGLGISVAANRTDSASDRRRHEGERNQVRRAGAEQALETLSRLLARDGIL